MAVALPYIPLPSSIHYGKLYGAVSIILSARFGKPIGYRLERLLNVTNTAFESYKPYLLAFGWTLQEFNHDNLVEQQDAKGTWAKRREFIKENFKRQEALYRQDLSYHFLFAFLVPEIAEKLALRREW